MCHSYTVATRSGLHYDFPMIILLTSCNDHAITRYNRLMSMHPYWTLKCPSDPMYYIYVASYIEIASYQSYIH